MAHRSSRDEARATSHGEARKIVTILFADLAGSTALHERLDPESVRTFMARYYAAMRSAVERNGGTVVKLLGDGVMAAFGVPTVTEDDARRAVRAAVFMQEAFRAIAGEQSDIGLRVAVNTGEVVVSADDSDVVGDPVNVAARLQQEAGDGDVVIGEATQRLVATQATLEPLGQFALKGRAEAVKAYRVVSLERPTGAATVPFVGRVEELRRILAVYETAATKPAARLAVLLGSPGLGKSRLIDETVRRLSDASTVLSAHCDAGGGATFEPIAAAVRQFLRVDRTDPSDLSGAPAAVRGAIEALLPGSEGDRARVAAGIEALLAGSPASPEETFFVVRRFLAALAAKRPVILVIDDIHWAEPLLLDLIEHLVQWGSGVPLLVLTGARPELRDVRSAFTTVGGAVSDVIPLSGLDAGAAMRLAANVVGAADLPAAAAGKVLAASEGNPLFVGELVRMLVQEGALRKEGDRWIVGEGLATLEMPPTIHALLAARIERLRADDRAVLERAAVVGRHFSRRAVAELLPAGMTDLDARLESLERSELIEPDSGWFLGEPLLRFHHALIADAAYRRLLKGTRAELHARLANWIEAKGKDSGEHDETIGRHLEQAHQLLRELGPLDAKGKDLGDRAAKRLAAAGRRALGRDDVPVAADLLGRAIDRLDADDPTRADLALDWCEALLAAGDVGMASTAIDELARFAEGGREGFACTSDERRATSHARLSAWHTCFTGQLTVLTAPQELDATVTAVAKAADEFAKLGDAAGEAKAHFVQAQALARLGRVGACEGALDKALAAARKAGDRRRANAVLAGAPLAALWGPSPVTRASGRCLDVVRVLRITQGAPAVEAVALSCQGVLEALRGRTDAARRMIASSRKMVEELGIAHRLYEADVFAGRIDLLEGDAEAAERKLRGAYDGLRNLGLGIDAARAGALLGRALLARGQGEEADELSRESERLAGDDLQASIAWRGVRAEALARRGEHAQAIDLAKAAAAIAAATDALLDHADARLALAAALRAAGRDQEGDAEERRAVELWDTKGATLLAERARSESRRSSSTTLAPEQPAEVVRTGRRHTRPNAATAAMERLESAFRTRDLGAIGALHDAALELVDHPNGSTYGFEGVLQTFERLLRSPQADFRFERLATLGQSLCLGRRLVTGRGTAGARFDVAEYDMDNVILWEIGADGRARRIEVFASDHLAEGIARLYERYAEQAPDGPGRERAASTACAVAAMLTRSKAHRLEDVMAPDLQVVDHRTIGRFEGSDVLSRWQAASNELVEDESFCLDDVLALSPDGLLRRTTQSGKVRASGGAFETSSWALSVFGPDGRQTRFEIFGIGHEAEALERFDELTAATPAAIRCVRENRATRSAARFDAVLAARDTDGLADLLSEQCELVHHATATTYGRRGMLTTWRSLFGAERLGFRYELLATLGDSLSLHRHVVSAEGFREEHLRAAGAIELEEICLTQVDENGRVLRFELFAADHLGAAIGRLYERYAEILRDSSARECAVSTARSVASVVGPFDVNRYAAAFAPGIEATDHRTLGTWSAHGVGALLEHFRSFVALVEGASMHADDVLALRSDGLLARWTNRGTDRTSGGTYERPFLMLSVYGHDGLIHRNEWFDVGQEAEALERFGEINAPLAEGRDRS